MPNVSICLARKNRFADEQAQITSMYGAGYLGDLHIINWLVVEMDRDRRDLAIARCVGACCSL